MSKDSPIFGIDVHPQYQAGLDFAAAKRQGYQFCFVKASQGSGYVPPCLKAYFLSAKATGLTMGLYHFLDATAPGPDQARHFARQVTALGGPEGLMLAVDFEHYGERSPSNRHLDTFVAQLRRTIGGHPIVLYTAKSFWESGDPSGPFSRYGFGDRDALWSARYATMAKQPYPRRHYDEIRDWSEAWDEVGGKTSDFWQFTSTGLVAGQYVDVNAYRGAREELLALARTPVHSPAPVQEEEPVPEEVPQWRKNWEVARRYGRNCAAADILYWFWDGGMLNRSVAGRPASVDGPAPRISSIRRGFCADLLSWMQRRCGLSIPKNRGAGWNYDGGTQAYWLKYQDVMVPFKVSEMRDGDVAFRRFVDGVEEGHIMVSDEGRALQSFARDNLGNPGPDRSHTVAESHAGGYYQYRIPREKFWV